MRPPTTQPELIEPSKSGLLGSIVSVGTRAGRGQVVLTSTKPSNINLYPCVPGSGTGSATSGGTGYTGGGVTAFTCCPGGTDNPAQSDSDVRLLTPGSYTFAYYLYDSNSGRRSAISNFAPCQSSDFSVGGAVATSRYAVVEITYDPTLWDQAFIYRSVRVEGVGTTYTAGILQLEAVITLSQYRTCRSPYSANVAQSIYYFTLEDKSLVSQPVYEDAAFFDETMPTGNLGTFQRQSGTHYLTDCTSPSRF